MASPRLQLAELLKPVLPKSWKIIAWQANLDALSSTVVIFKQDRIERAKAAPLGAHDIGFIVTVISPMDDPEKAEDDLDDSVDDLIHALDQLGIAWTSAQKVSHGANLGYDITLTLVSTKE